MSLKNNEIRVTVSAMSVGEQYESVDVVAEYGDGIPMEELAREIVMITAAAAAITLNAVGVSYHLATNILKHALDNAYAAAKEDGDA